MSKSQGQIQSAIRRLKLNKERSRRFDAFGGRDQHEAIDVMIQVLEKGLGKESVNLFNKNIKWAFWQILKWRDAPDLEDMLFPESECYGLDMTLNFGKYDGTGKTLEEIIDTDIQYVEWALKKVSYFKLDSVAEGYYKTLIK